MERANYSAARKQVSAHKGLGYPKIPDEIAGIDIDLQLSLLAQAREERTAEVRRSTSFFRP